MWSSSSLSEQLPKRWRACRGAVAARWSGVRDDVGRAPTPASARAPATVSRLPGNVRVSESVEYNKPTARPACRLDRRPSSYRCRICSVLRMGTLP